MPRPTDQRAAENARDQAKWWDGFKLEELQTAREVTERASEALTRPVPPEELMDPNKLGTFLVDSGKSALVRDIDRAIKDIYDRARESHGSG